MDTCAYLTPTPASRRRLPATFFPVLGKTFSPILAKTSRSPFLGSELRSPDLATSNHSPVLASEIDSPVLANQSRSPRLATGELPNSGDVSRRSLDARIQVLSAGQIYRPTRLQFALAYLRNGDAPPMFGLPPIALDDLALFTFSMAACLALGVLLGSAIA